MNNQEAPLYLFLPLLLPCVQPLMLKIMTWAEKERLDNPQLIFSCPFLLIAKPEVESSGRMCAYQEMK